MNLKNSQKIQDEDEYPSMQQYMPSDKQIIQKFDGAQEQLFIEQMLFQYDDFQCSQQISQAKIDVIVIDFNSQDTKKCQKINIVLNDKSEIVLNQILKNLENSGIEIRGSMISYLDPFKDMFINIGKLPFSENKFIDRNFLVNNQLTLKIRRQNKSMVDLLLNEQTQKEEKSDLRQQNKIIFNERTKERRIGEVIEKVALWRKFYTGYQDEQGKISSMGLEQSANKVGISKKTLDDYLLQIKCGKRYGFDFHKNKNERVGKLRTFVKKYKSTLYKENDKNNIQYDNAEDEQMQEEDVSDSIK